MLSGGAEVDERCDADDDDGNDSDRIHGSAPLLTLIYPSKFLIDSYNPIDCLNRNLSLDEIEQEIKGRKSKIIVI